VLPVPGRGGTTAWSALSAQQFARTQALTLARKARLKVGFAAMAARPRALRLARLHAEGAPSRRHHHHMSCTVYVHAAAAAAAAAAPRVPCLSRCCDDVMLTGRGL
jgi:hypothetical protein